ncbi:hypothetical protein QT972_09640 [Microcoleus sp. herbarium7]|uniref:hypothetical protein n=1 Tax=Microcoleus sp. herbarium7 TaxID=3055435 RepID=UPI002FD5F8BD
MNFYKPIARNAIGLLHLSFYTNRITKKKRAIELFDRPLLILPRQLIHQSLDTQLLQMWAIGLIRSLLVHN